MGCRWVLCGGCGCVWGWYGGGLKETTVVGGGSLLARFNSWVISVMDGPRLWIVEVDVGWVGFEPMLAGFEPVMGLALVWVLLRCWFCFDWLLARFESVMGFALIRCWLRFASVLAMVVRLWLVLVQWWLVFQWW